MRLNDLHRSQHPTLTTCFSLFILLHHFTYSLTYEESKTCAVNDDDDDEENEEKNEIISRAVRKSKEYIAKI